ncbi:uncharacterized protein BDV17DRAFT_286984 [Aspergillus undulatus]|uniref:uncharacterized protein n=1 Tax=Aspergillus undulatus TaxID=1810928 RepID=UPI003CCDE629
METQDQPFNPGKTPAPIEMHGLSAYPEFCAQSSLTTLPPYAELDPNVDLEHGTNNTDSEQTPNADTIDPALGRTQTGVLRSLSTRRTPSGRKRCTPCWVIVLIVLVILGVCIGAPVGTIMVKKKHQHQQGLDHIRHPTPVPVAGTNDTLPAPAPSSANKAKPGKGTETGKEPPAREGTAYAYTSHVHDWLGWILHDLTFGFF